MRQLLWRRVLSLHLTPAKQSGLPGASGAFPEPSRTPRSSQPRSPRPRQQQRWQRECSNGEWLLLSCPHRVTCWGQALRFSSAASPSEERGGIHESSGEQTSNASGNEQTPADPGEKVEGVPEGKDERPPKSEEVEKEQAAKRQQEETEALLKSIRQIDATLAEKSSQLVELEERSVTTKAELDNVRVRAQREADHTRKFAIQDFAKSLSDVADNLGRTLTTIPANVRKELLTDDSETGKLLKGLVEGVMMTEKELMKVLKKYGVEKCEPVGQPFDPNSPLALFEVADPSKESGNVAMVAKVGYMLHDRVLRPAEGVVESRVSSSLAT